MLRVLPLNIYSRAKTVTPDRSSGSNAPASRAVSLDTGRKTKRCLLTSCIQVNEEGRLPRLLSNLENHTQPVAPKLRGILMDSLVPVTQPTRIVTAPLEHPSSYFPDSLSLPPTTLTLGRYNLTQPTSKVAVRQENSYKTIDPGAPKNESLAHQIINTNVNVVCGGALNETMQANEYSIARIIQSNVAAIRRTDNTVIKRIRDQLASNKKALDEFKVQMDNMDARAASLDAMTDRIQTLTSNSTLQELCVITKDQEEIDRIVAHLSAQLDKTAKSFDEAYALAYEFFQRVAPYRTQLPVFEKMLTLLTLKRDAIRNKVRATEVQK